MQGHPLSPPSRYFLTNAPLLGLRERFCRIYKFCTPAIFFCWCSHFRSAAHNLHNTSRLVLFWWKNSHGYHCDLQPRLNRSYRLTSRKTWLKTWNRRRVLQWCNLLLVSNWNNNDDLSTRISHVQYYQYISIIMLDVTNMKESENSREISQIEQMLQACARLFSYLHELLTSLLHLDSLLLKLNNRFRIE